MKNDEELRTALGGSSISLFNSGEHVIFSKFEKDETGRQTSRAEGDEPEAYVEADSLAMNDTKFILHEALTLTLNPHPHPHPHPNPHPHPHPHPNPKPNLLGGEVLV